MASSPQSQSGSNDTFNRGGFIAFIFSMVFSLLFFVYVAVIHPGIDLKEVPDEAAGTEQTLAGAPAKADVSKIEKPWEPNPDMVAHGKGVFQNNCAICHGAEGKGDGAAGKSLVPPPRDLVAGQWVKGGDSISLFNTIKNGLPGTSMAAFGHLPVTDRWALVQFIHSITTNKKEDNAAELEKFAQAEK